MTGSDFLSLFSPLVRSIQRRCYLGKAFDKAPIMTHSSCEGTNVSKSLQNGGTLKWRPHFCEKA